MGCRQIVLLSTAGFSVLNMGIFWLEAKTKRLFSQCRLYVILKYVYIKPPQDMAAAFWTPTLWYFAGKLDGFDKN
jgi:hypothetical protein